MTVLDAVSRILGSGGLSVRFQPIVERRDGGWELRGVESLVRGPVGTNLEPAEILFDYVRRKRAEARVDRACVAAVFAEARHLPSGLAVSVNVHAATITRDPDFVGHLLESAAGAGIGCGDVTIEIVEHAPRWAGPELASALAAVRDAGIRVALDDVGLGQSNLRMVVDCRPDWLKVDGYFVRGAHSDGYRRAVLASVVTLARSIGASVVAEGVEEEADLETALALGVTLFQGFLFSRAIPARELTAWADLRARAAEGCAAAAGE
jgi:EAL domain-containing protein (putative c-di-GMP-specific phosphodiesterase class I)